MPVFLVSNHTNNISSAFTLQNVYSLVSITHIRVNPTGRIYISRHVIFNENEFSFQSDFLNKRNSSQRSETIIQYLPLHTPLSYDPTCSTDAIHPDATPTTSHSSEQIEVAGNVASEENENENIEVNDEHTQVES